MNEVRYMFDTALKKLSEVGAYTCALESVEDVKRFMQIRFLGSFVKHELLSPTEAEEIFHEKKEKVATSGIRWVSRNRRARVSFVMPKSLGVKYPERCYEVQSTRVAWAAEEMSYGRKSWGRRDEVEGVPERGWSGWKWKVRRRRLKRRRRRRIRGRTRTGTNQSCC